jgi:hypothetical protein
MPASQEAETLRDAAARGDFETAAAAVSRYVRSLIPRLADLPPAEAAAGLQNACELLEWSRCQLCAARARVADQIRRLDSLGRYHTRQFQSTFRIDG